MTRDLQSRLPVPVETTGFDFLKSQAAPAHVVLEFRTKENPLRIFLTKAQAEELASKARIAAAKIQS